MIYMIFSDESKYESGLSPAELVSSVVVFNASSYLFDTTKLTSRNSKIS